MLATFLLYKQQKEFIGPVRYNKEGMTGYKASLFMQSSYIHITFLSSKEDGICNVYYCLSAVTQLETKRKTQDVVLKC